MSYQTSARTAARRTRSAVLAAALLVVSAILVCVLGYPSVTVLSSSASPQPIALSANDPSVANLDPDLLHALRRAATDASGDGIEFYVNSGWRSRKQQERLFREAVSKYGSKAEAARWVATPGTSAHESGHAVDLGPSTATAWLAQHGATYGLCQIYRSEAWHYELRPDAVHHDCPAMFADPTQDPRTWKRGQRGGSEIHPKPPG